MQRTPEPDLMNNPEQVQAYAEADFDQPHEQFVALFRVQFPSANIDGVVLDLGCGPGDISWRFAQAYPLCRIDAVDGAVAMLAYGQALIERRGAQDRVCLHQCYLPGILPASGYDTIISNSLLHHLSDPLTLWQTIAAAAVPGAEIFVMDLMRPSSREQAQMLVDQYAASEPDILRHDFYHSLLAAYTVAEVEAQLTVVGLKELRVMVVSDRHFIVSGYRAG
jgi:cyclopropane fatty-acyl-phospholipid synthase-like methyltransferase